MELQTNTKENKNQPLFRDLKADDTDPEITEIESLCVQCGENGTTKLLFTKIPFYKEVVIMSFICEHCNWENNELQPAAKIQEQGIRYVLHVLNDKDLSRRIVKTEWASVTIPDLEFEIPAQTQEGSVTTIEGIIDRTCSGLSSKVEDLKVEDSDSAEKLEAFLKKLTELKSGNVTFYFVLRDCTGNSFIENLCAPLNDPQLEVSHFERNHEENLMLGTCNPNDEEAPSIEKPSNLKDEVLGFPTNCPSCNAPCITNMKVTQIPHFKEVVIMATICEVCGHKTNEVKGASGIESLGTKISLKIEDTQDLTRDLVKADTCSINIPELEMEVGPSLLGGRYTTVEGILINIKEQLKGNNPLTMGDSADTEVKQKLELFLSKLDEIILGKRKATLVLDDPCGNSYLQSFDSPELNENLTIEKYERTREQNDDLGLLDIKVENYEES